MFWTDCWVGNDTLKNRYPRLYSNSVLKDGSVDKFGIWHVNQWVWQIEWRREWFSWEYEIINTFMDELKTVKIDAYRNDEWLWLGDNSNSFTVNSAYNVLLCQNTLLPQLSPSFNFDFFWRLKALPSAHYFAWRVLTGKIATYDNLLHRGIQTGGGMCVMCGIELETVNHLFFTCKVASKVWCMTDVWVGRAFVHCDNATQHFEQFGFMDLSYVGNCVWKCMWISIIWGIWNHRNRIIFNSAVVDPIEIFAMAQVKGWAWVTYKFPKSNFSYSDWCFDVYECLKSLH